MNSSLLRILVALIIGIGVLIGYFTYQSYKANHLPTGEDDSVTVIIPRGAGFSEILDSLEEKGLIGERLSFEILAVATGAGDEIQSGSYRFESGLSHTELLDHLKNGKSAARVKVTFPEGVTIRRIASIAQDRAGVDSTELVTLANDREFLATIGLTASTAEGYLMPDTYFFDWGVSAETVLREMSLLFRDYYNEQKQNRAREQTGLTPYETVILASLVEGEARTEEDRTIVAGLYLNRLRKKMLLQADPTIQYILPDGPRRLLYEDLRIDNPYNTYRNPGLPPTPINNPGRASLEAAIDPAETDYLYMVAKADGSGAHTFSRTLSEHQVAVNRYRRNVAAQRAE